MITQELDVFEIKMLTAKSCCRFANISCGVLHDFDGT